MGISLRPERLKRYRDIAGLLLKYGGDDVVRRAGLEEAVQSPAPADAVEADKATALARDLERLGPTFIKLGQVLAVRHDLLPPEYTDALSRLQDHVAPFPFEQAEHTIQTEIGVRISKIFTEIDSQPVASASLGQVHRATLRDGRIVAVKVQRPGIRQRIDSDLDALDDIARFLDSHTEIGRAYSFVAILEEFRKTLYRELDYRKEAENMTLIGRNLEQFERIVIPQPIADLTNGRVLTMDFIRGRKITRVSPLTRLELDGRELAEELFAAYLKQILADGYFHADPHPGNVFLTDDHRIALLDLGMTGSLGPVLQEQLLRLVLAISEGRSDDAVEVLVKIGTPTDKFNKQEVTEAVSEFVAETNGRSLEQMQLGRRIMQVSSLSARAGLRLPPEMVLIARALINLDHVGRILDPDFDPNESIRENAAEILQERLVKSATPGRIFANMLEAKDMAANVPSQLNRILEHLANNDMSFDVHAFDEDRLMGGLHKIANRITVGLVLSALIIGAALLMRVPTHFTLLGYPGIAMVFFSVAAIGGLALVVSILRD